MMKSQGKIYFFLILLLGTGLRLYNLGRNSLWSDEASFILFRSGNLFESLKFVQDKLFKEGLGIANYGYYLFTTLWSCLVNNNEFMLRLSSVIFGTFCIFLIYKVGKLFFDKNTGLITSFMLSISPFHIYYSQEFRMYSLISLLTLASVYSLRRFQQTGKNKFLWGYVISNALGFYMHIATILILFAQIVFFIFYRKTYRSLLKKWLIGNLAIIFLIMPGILLTAIELIRHKDMSTILSLTVSSVSELGSIKLLLPLYTFKNFSIGYNALPLIWVPCLFLFFVFFSRGLINIKNKETLHLCLCCLFIPVLAMYLGQRFLYSDRYLIPSSLFLYLIVAGGISCSRRSLLIFTLIFFPVLVFFSLKNYYKDYLPCPHEQRCAVHEKKAVREAAAYILSSIQKEDIIFHTEPNTTLVFEYYFNYYFRAKNNRLRPFHKEQIAMVLRFSEKNRDLSAFKTWDNVGSIFSKTPVTVTGHKRVWLVFSAREFNEALKLDSEESRVLQWLSKHYLEEDARYFKGIIVYLFRSPKEANEYEKSSFS